MDHRVPLKFHTVLAFEGMSCHVEEVIGQGSNAIVYKGWYWDRLNQDLRHHVLIKELFPFHPQQRIRREADGSILVEPEAEELWRTHWSSFESGNEVHLRLLADHPDLMVMGANLNSFHYNGTLYSVLGFTGGRSLQTELNRMGQDLRRAAVQMLGVLEALEAFHKSGYLHLDISPDNIMLVGSGEHERVFLIDYNSARPVDSRDSSYLSCKAGYSAPEVGTGNCAAIDFSSDLYSVAAVFYRYLMGRTLTLAETLRAKAPDGRDSPLLADAPQTVRNMVGRILKKGLHTLPARRYRSIGQMRQAFQELIDRIDCVGVTHWALWENGKRSVEELIKMNPSLRYLKEEKNLYPIRLEQEGSMSLGGYLATVMSPEGRSGLILAQGGMGKTTLLLHTALLQGKRYAPSAPAVFYISLNGWRGGDTQYIRSQILMSLRFKREMNTFDSAMHALHRLLQQRIQTKAGELPTVLLLLDGLNEIRDDMGPLVQEINELNAMAGVRIIAASRSEIPALSLETVRLMPLDMEDIEAALGGRGLLIPQNQTVLQLLRTPLVLSIYLQAGEAGRQLDIQSEEELMRAYLDTLLKKERQDLTEDDPRYWQVDAALNFVLPALAVAVNRAGHALTDEQLLKTIEQCWKLLHTRKLRRKFPQWIGRSRDIQAEADRAEDWYGIMVHNLLWQRLGMLMRGPDGGYRVFHQVMEEYLAAAFADILPGTVLRRVILAAAAMLLCGGLLAGYGQYRAEVAQDLRQAMEYAAAGYQSSGNLYRQLRQLTDYAIDGSSEAFFAEYDRVLSALNLERGVSASEAVRRAHIEDNCNWENGMTVSWSGLPFAYDLTLELLGYASGQADYYAEVLPSLAGWMESESLRERCPDLAALLSQVLEADAQLASELYQQTCADHLEQGDALWAGNIQAMVAEIHEQEAHRLTGRDGRSPSLDDLRVALRNAKSGFEEENKSIERHLKNSIQTVEQKLYDIKQAVEAAGIDAMITELTEMAQIIVNCEDYVRYRFQG